MKKRVSKAAKIKEMKRLGISTWLRMSLIIFSTVVILISAYLLYITQKHQKYIEQKNNVYSYSNRANVNYEVFLIPNELFPENSLGEGNIYMKNLTDYINTTFKYEFNGEKPGQVQGKYNVTAILEGLLPGDESGRAVWKKEYILQPDTSFKGEDKVVSAESKIPVKIKDYLGFIDLAEKTTGMNFISRLTVSWNVSMEAKTDKGTVKESLAPTIIIPLSGNYFEIKGNLSEDKKGAIEETKQIISPDYNNKIILFCTAAGICIVSLLFLLIFTVPSAKLSPIAKKRKQIFKDHGNRMAAVWSEVSAVSKTAIEVSRIEDLVKIADDIGRPILYKNSLNEEEIYNFYVVDEDKLYIFDIRREFENISAESNSGVNTVIV